MYVENPPDAATIVAPLSHDSPTIQGLKDSQRIQGFKDSPTIQGVKESLKYRLTFWQYCRIQDPGSGNLTSPLPRPPSHRGK